MKKVCIINHPPVHGSHALPLTEKEDILHRESLKNGDNFKKLGRHLEDSHKIHSDDKEALDRYSAGSYHLNKTLREGGKHSDIPKLDKALNRHTLNRDVHVWHGVGFNPDHEASKSSSRTIQLPGYTSTSISPHVAKRFGGGHIIHIHLKKGDAGHYLGSRSRNSNEYEHLLPRNTKLKIHPTPTVFHDSLGKRHIWHAEIVRESH